MKKTLLVLTAILSCLQIVISQTDIFLGPTQDGHIEAFGGGQGKNAFIKFDISSIPDNCLIIDATLRVFVKEIGTTWDRDMMYIHYTNQIWTETDSTQNMWNDIYWGDTLIQNIPLFGDTLGHSHSINLASLMNQDYIQDFQFFSIRMKDPDDPTMVPMLNIPITNSFDSLMVGNIFNDYIILQPRDFGLAVQRPVIFITYIYVPQIDPIIGGGLLCEDVQMELSASVSGDGPLSFIWQKDNIDIPGATDSILTINSLVSGDAGWYRLIASSPWASDTSDAIQVSVQSCASIPNGGIQALTIYPNPSNGICKVEGLRETVQIDVHTALGRCVQHFFEVENNSIIDLGDLPAGIYTLKVSGTNTSSEIKLIIID